MKQGRKIEGLVRGPSRFPAVVLEDVDVEVKDGDRRSQGQEAKKGVGFWTLFSPTFEFRPYRNNGVSASRGFTNHIRFKFKDLRRGWRRQLKRQETIILSNTSRTSNLNA